MEIADLSKRYRIEKSLGKGGMGEVLLATDTRLDRQVAIKRIGDRPVFVRDVARVVDSQADRTTYSRMGGQPSITLSVTKRSGTNILEVADRVDTRGVAPQPDITHTTNPEDQPQGRRRNTP